jgi:hypothetical protein
MTNQITSNIRNIFRTHIPEKGIMVIDLKMYTELIGLFEDIYKFLESKGVEDKYKVLIPTSKLSMKDRITKQPYTMVIKKGERFRFLGVTIQEAKLIANI